MAAFSRTRWASARTVQALAFLRSKKRKAVSTSRADRCADERAAELAGGGGALCARAFRARLTGKRAPPRVFLYREGRCGLDHLYSLDARLRCAARSRFHAAILDEAQAIKNPKATVSASLTASMPGTGWRSPGRRLRTILARRSLFQFLSPGLLGDETAFRRNFRTPIEKHGDKAAQAFLSARLKPFSAADDEAGSGQELPPKTEIVEHVRLEGRNGTLRDRAFAHASKSARRNCQKGPRKSHIIFLDALLKLRQICCDPRLLKMPQAQR